MSTGECEWLCRENFERLPVTSTDDEKFGRGSRDMCKCLEGKDCFQCAALPDDGGLLNICEMFTDPATGICTFDSTTTAGLVLAVSCPYPPP